MAGENINDPLDLNKFVINSGGSSSSAAKDLNYQQDLLSYLMSASTGIGTGTFDPLLAVPPEYLPPATTYLDSFERSATPVLSAVARKIRAGLIDPASAVAEIATTLGVTDSMPQAGFDMKSIRDNVSAMFAEVTSTIEAENKHLASVKDWETTNQYGKAGFSQPYEQYTMETLPFSSNVQDKQSQLDWLRRESEMNREKVQPKFESDFQALYEKMMTDYAKTNTSVAQQAKMDANLPKYDMYGVQTEDPNADPNQQGFVAPSPFYNPIPTDTTTDSSGAVVAPIATQPSQSAKNKRLMEDQQGRAGIALSYKAAEQARAKNPLNQKKDERDKLARQLMITKMAELAAAQYLGRTPFSDQLSQRASSL